jgi:hypothetical protein
MIDSTIEALITLAEAAKVIPRSRGRKAHLSTVYRWTKPPGCRGVILETIQAGGARCTSREALQRFFLQLSTAGPTDAAPAGRSFARRRRESAEAKRRLIEIGA